MEQQIQQSDRLDGMWHCQQCGKWLGVIANGRLTMAHASRKSVVRGEIEIVCERCHAVNVTTT